MHEISIQGDKRMTIREVAEVLGVTDEAISILGSCGPILCITVLQPTFLSLR
jgi:hypothetical protein